MRYLEVVLIGGVLGLSGGAWAQAAKSGGAASQQADVISGGIGLNARDELAAKARDYNLKLVFALASREYVSDVDVEIAGAGGRSVATHQASGPWMFAKLAPGDYTVRATFNGNTQTKKVSVGQQGQKVVNFLWPTSAGATGTADPAAR